MGKNINDATPNNLTVANNIITRANVFGIATGATRTGPTSTATFVLTSPGAYGPLSVAASSRNISYHNNIFQNYNWLSSTGALPYQPCSDNVALKPGYVLPASTTRSTSSSHRS